MTVNVTTTVNGKEVSGEVEPNTLLVHFIRENLGLTGTHVGCDTSQCGACVVHVDGNVDAASDIETIDTELLLADMDTAARAAERAAKEAARKREKSKFEIRNLGHLEDTPEARGRRHLNPRSVGITVNLLAVADQLEANPVIAV